MKTIGGFVAIRNNFDLDYMVDLAIQSMLPICSEIVVAESASTDYTREFLNEWAARESKLHIVDFPWTDPRADTSFYPTWINFAREHLTTDHSCYLDADEVFSEDSLPRIQQAAERGEVLMCRRHNFWKDAQSLIPNGVCLGRDVIRVGPQQIFLPSDYQDPLGRDKEAARLAIREPAVEIFHYGFLRKRDAFFRKARAVQRIWADSYDARLEAVEKKEGNWMTDKTVSEWVDRLEPFTGTHPQIAHEWLGARGYSA